MIPENKLKRIEMGKKKITETRKHEKHQNQVQC